MLYCPSPIETFEARQINTQQDLNEWIASLTYEDHLHGENFTFSNLQGTLDEENGEVRIQYHVHSDVDGDWNTEIRNPIGWWAISHVVVWGVYGANLWMEDNDNFLRRFQPYTQPPA